MAKRKPKVGDAVSHDGNWAGHDHEDTDFFITALRAGGEDPDDPLRRVKDHVCTFENGRYKVSCLTSELGWFEDDGAWVLPGRLLSKAQRATYCAMTGAPTLPPIGHVAARRILAADPGAAATLGVTSNG